MGLNLKDQEKIIRIRAMTRFHFIVGLPRSGASVLSAILRQNPRFVAPGVSPACDLLAKTVDMFADDGPLIEGFSDAQRVALWRAVLDAVYHDRPFDSVVFDKNQNWLGYTDLLVPLFPLSRFILCVRNPAAIVNELETSGVSAALSPDEGFHGRLAGLLGDGGPLGKSLSQLRTALSGEQSERMIVIDYDRLLDDPEEVMDVLYDFLRENWFEHDFGNLAPTISAAGSEMPGVISGPLERSDMPMHLSAKTVQQLSGKAFWRNLRRTYATMLLGRVR